LDVVNAAAGRALNFELRVLDHQPGNFVFSAWGNVLFFFWVAPATPESISRLAACTEPLYEQNPGGLSNVHVVESGTGLPSPEVRELLIGLMRRRAARRACLAVVPAGAGFWASTLRSFATGIRLMSPRSFEMGIHTSLEEVADWLPGPHFERTGTRLDRTRLLDAMRRTETLSHSPVAQQIVR
jgi:hypothetical protein